MAIRDFFSKIFERNNIYYINNSLEQPSIDGFDTRELYATQANLYAVISFIADSVAQLPLKTFVRLDDSSRLRDRTSNAAKLLYKPNKDQTAYEFWNALVTEYLLFGEAIVLVLDDDSESGYQLRIIPSDWVVKRDYATNFAPTKLYIRANAESNLVELDAKDLVIFRMYAPGSPANHQSPITSLKQTLSEQIQASRFRNDIWRSGGRMNAYITRPANVAPWTKEARETWTEGFRKGWTYGGQRAGSMPILEDGMEIKPFNFSAKEAQYIESIQLSREDVSAAYHINSSLIWHTNTQTYASAKDNARALYADCLGPLLQMLQQRINSFLLPMLDSDPDTYVEFDLDEKLKGSFEERASIYQSAAGVPYLTVNEVRAELNRPPVEGGDERVIPLNVLIGGQASPQDSAPDSYSNMYSSNNTIDTKQSTLSNVSISTTANEDELKTVQDIIERFIQRQEKSISTKLKAVEDWWDESRWNKELADDLYPIIMNVSDELGKQIAEELGSIYYSENTEEYLYKLAEYRAKYINTNTYEALINGIEQGISSHEVFNKRILTAATIAAGIISSTKEFAVNEAVEQAEFQGVISKPKITKTWHTGANARDSHAAMNGETVGFDEVFSNGLRWPHDFGPADETCGCNCSVDINIEY